MVEVDVSAARQRDNLAELDETSFLPAELQSLSPEARQQIMEFALGWGQMAAEATRMESVSPLDSRYTDQEVQRFLSEQTRIGYQATVESALAQTLAEFGICSQRVADEISAACQNVRAEAVYQGEFGVTAPDGTKLKPGTRHDIKALTNVISEQVSDEAKPMVHMTATSFDIISTAEALRYREATQQLLVPRLVKLENILLDLAERYADTPQIGRSHGQHGEPITFGFAIAQTVERLGASLMYAHTASDQLKGKFSGAMGAYNASSLLIENPIAFEEALLEKLGLNAEPISTQIAPPDNVVRLMDELSIASGVMSNLANDMRQLQRTEIEETREAFDSKNQTGSSAMPHKRNPISFENICSLNRVVKAMVQIGHDNLESEHQRDLRDSASSRFYPEIFATVAEMARRLADSMAKIEIDEDRLWANLKMGGGKIASGLLQTALREAGHAAAHDASREVMAHADAENITFQEALQKNESIMEYVNKMSEQERAMIFEPERLYLGQASAKTRSIVSEWRKFLAAFE